MTKSWELRAAIEGFDTADLQDANELLATSGSRRRNHLVMPAPPFEGSDGFSIRPRTGSVEVLV